MTGAFVAGMLAGYGVAIPVGAIAVLILGLSARVSFRVGAGAALGVATADGLYAAVASLGGAALAGLIAPIAQPLRWIAALVLLGLAGHGGWRALRQRRQPPEERRGETLSTPGRAFVAVLTLTLLNPMTIVYFAALVVGRQTGAEPSTGAAAFFVVGAFVASASWQLLIAGGGSLVGSVFAGTRGRLVTALLSSAIIAVLAVSVLLGG